MADTILSIYIIVTYIVSFFILLRVPTGSSTLVGVGGSIVAAATGPVLWPFFVAYVVKNKK